VRNVSTDTTWCMGQRLTAGPGLSSVCFGYVQCHSTGLVSFTLRRRQFRVSADPAYGSNVGPSGRALLADAPERRVLHRAEARNFRIKNVRVSHRERKYGKSRGLEPATLAREAVLAFRSLLHLRRHIKCHSARPSVPALHLSRRAEGLRNLIRWKIESGRQFISNDFGTRPLFSLTTIRPVAKESADHIWPRGAKYDNSTNRKFNLKLYSYFQNLEVEVLKA
jgi:hypothetical protein